MWYNHKDLCWQYDYRGAKMQNIRLLVCRPCLDMPQPQLKSIVLSADPLPIRNPRTEQFVADETDYQSITLPSSIDPDTGIPVPNDVTLQTEDGQDLTTQQAGRPAGIDQSAVPTQYGTQMYDVPLSLLSVTSNGTDQINVTTQTPHGLATNGQIVVQGLTDTRACGAYSVVVTGALSFTYQTYDTVPSASLLQPTTVMVTALIGLPYNDDEIQQTGG